VINLIVCSIDRLNKTWKIIFPKKISFNVNRFRKLKIKNTFVQNADAEKTLSAYKQFLSKQFKKMAEKETENSTAIYVEKGRWARFGVYIVHISIILLLIGALIGAIFGFKSSMNLIEGQSADSIAISKDKIEKKFGFTIKCNTFVVKFYDTGAPKEFKSNISIIENDKEVFQKDIIVNDPLRYKNINFFQSSYGVASADGVTLEIESKKSKMIYHQDVKINETFTIPENGGQFTLVKYVPQFDFRGHNIGESFLGTVKKADGKEIRVVLPTKFPTFDKMRKGDFAFIPEKSTKKYYTGLQVTYDPGVLYVYIGFVFMIIGCYVTFFISHQSIMVEITKGNDDELSILVSGNANRNNQSMKMKIEKLAGQLSGLHIK
ncbi:MAG: cytochrome c biogenesis protein ResB, partial [Desulfobacteraceae bacterium]|nr:cytochrome c biogenesis protein ResB [Desulfobacteraceae bacterium]